MTSSEWPPLIILVCGCLFLVLGLAYPWLSMLLGTDQSRPDKRALSFILGLTLLLLWSIWYFFGRS